MTEAEKIQKYTAEEYYSLSNETMSELIEGIIYDMSPLPLRIHQEISGEIFGEIREYIKKKGGKCKVYSAPFDVKLSEDTIVIPDISVICDREKLTDKGCNGAPDWVIEITSSNFAHDYLRKSYLYYDAGVREYWIADPKKQKVTVHLFRQDGDIDTTVYQFSDTIPVNIYNGDLSINISELLD